MRLQFRNNEEKRQENERKRQQQKHERQIQELNERCDANLRWAEFILIEIFSIIELIGVFQFNNYAVIQLSSVRIPYEGYNDQQQIYLVNEKSYMDLSAWGIFRREVALCVKFPIAKSELDLNWLNASFWNFQWIETNSKRKTASTRWNRDWKAEVVGRVLQAKIWYLAGQIGT